MKSLRSWLEEGQYTLALSAGFFGFFAHCGFVTALFEEGFDKPQRITGTSAGAIVGAALASGMSPADLKKLLFSIEREHFWDPAPGFGLLSGEKFRAIGNLHFAPTFQQTRIPLSVVSYDIFGFRSQVLEQGSVAEAVSASSAFPGLFHPVRVGRRFFWDGGILARSALVKKHAGERTLCHYLCGEGWASQLEKKVQLSRLRGNHKALILRDLPAVHYNRLEAGKLAFDESYGRTKIALDQPFSGNVLESY